MNPIKSQIFMLNILSKSDFQKLVRGYKEHTIPLDALVIDMDWHITFYSAKHKDKVSYQYVWG